MEVIACIGRISRFTVESEFDPIGSIRSKVNLSELTFRIDTIERVSVTGVGPLSDIGPSSPIIGSNEDIELLRVLFTGFHRLFVTSSLGESQVESELLVSLHLNRRTYDPISGSRIFEIEHEVIVSQREDAVSSCYNIPSLLACLERCPFVEYIAEEGLIAHPLAYQISRIEGLYERHPRSSLEGNRFAELAGSILCVRALSGYAHLIFREFLQALQRVGLLSDLKGSIFLRTRLLVLQNPSGLAILFIPVELKGILGDVSSHESIRRHTRRSIIDEDVPYVDIVTATRNG